MPETSLTTAVRQSIAEQQQCAILLILFMMRFSYLICY